MLTGRLTRAPGDPVLVQKIFAPTPALQANSMIHSSKSGRLMPSSCSRLVPQCNTPFHAVVIVKAGGGGLPVKRKGAAKQPGSCMVLPGAVPLRIVLGSMETA